MSAAGWIVALWVPRARMRVAKVAHRLTGVVWGASWRRKFVMGQGNSSRDGVSGELQYRTWRAPGTRTLSHGSAVADAYASAAV